MRESSAKLDSRSWLAAKARSDFEAAGWTVTDISGYAGGNIAHSTAYFRPGTPEESAAQELGREFGLRVEPRFLTRRLAG